MYSFKEFTHNTSYISKILWSGKKFSDCKLTKNYDTSDAERTKVSCERKFFTADANGIDGVGTI